MGTVIIMTFYVHLAAFHELSKLLLRLVMGVAVYGTLVAEVQGV